MFCDILDDVEDEIPSTVKSKSHPSARWANWRVEPHVFICLQSIYTCNWVERLSSSCAKV